MVGVGTVLDAGTARDAISVGAEFVVSPGFDAGVVEETKKRGKISIPGAFTPTEIVRAWDLGADAVKIFPASLGGPSYIKALKAPLPNIPMIPTGGVDERTVGDFFRAGAFAVGAGGAIFDLKRLKAKDYAGMTEVAKRFTTALRLGRE